MGFTIVSRKGMELAEVLFSLLALIYLISNSC